MCYRKATFDIYLEQFFGKLELLSNKKNFWKSHSTYILPIKKIKDRYFGRKGKLIIKQT